MADPLAYGFDFMCEPARSIGPKLGLVFSVLFRLTRVILR